MILPGTDYSLSEALCVSAKNRPDAPLIISSSARPAELSLSHISMLGQRFGAHLMRIGIRPGDVVAVQLPAWAEWMIACTGIAHAGAILLPIVSIYGTKELRYILQQSDAKLLITPDHWRKIDYLQIVADCGDLPAFRHHVVICPDAPASTISWDSLLAPIDIPPAAKRLTDDLAMLVYTSGTTANPKGVQHSNRTIMSEMAAQAHARRKLVAERAMSPWPPGHVAGAMTMLRYMVYGTPLVVMDQWNPAEAAMLIEKHRVTSCSFTPFHLAGLLDAADADGRDLSSLVSVLVGATPVPQTLIERCTAHGLRTFRSYGSSEMPTVTMGDPDDPLEKRLTTEGQLMLGAEIRFVDDEGHEVEEGELAVRGPDLFVGYREESLNAKSFLPGGWFLTGDVGKLDSDGYLLITDRKKDVIIRGGENISSREVEGLLFQHPDILEAAVVAAPDARMGEIVCAFIIPRPGCSMTLERVREHFFSAGIAKQKTPERIFIMSDFPRNSTGKVLKQDLRAKARTAAETGAA